MGKGKKIFFILISLFLVRCSVYKYIPEGSLYLAREPRFKNNKTFPEDILLTKIKTHENRRVFFMKPYLVAYLIAQEIKRDSSFVKKLWLTIDKKRKVYNYIIELLEKEIGEPPALLDKKTLEEDIRNLKNFYFSKGFFKSQIYAYVHIKKRKRAFVTFLIYENEVYKYLQVIYLTKDTTVKNILESNKSNSFIKVGDRYDEDILDKERFRIADTLQNYGYFKFSPAYINYLVDTLNTDTLLPDLATNPFFILSNISKKKTHSKGIILYIKLPNNNIRYKVKELNIKILDSDLEDDSLITKKLPTTCAIKLNCEYNALKHISIKHFPDRITVCPPEFYNNSKYRTTTSLINELGIFSSVFWKHTTNDSTKELISNLNLRLRKRWRLEAGVEAFQSSDKQLNSNLPGFGWSVRINNYNLFKRGEKIFLSNSANLRIYKPDPNADAKIYLQLGSRLNVFIPRKIIPTLKSFNKRPSTNLNVSYTRNVRDEFKRTYWTSSLLVKSYKNISPTKIMELIFQPLEVQLVNSEISNNFYKVLLELPVSIRDFVIRDYTPRVSSVGQLSLAILSKNYIKTPLRSGYFIKVSGFVGGNTPFLYDYIQAKLFNSGDRDYKDGQIEGIYKYGMFSKAILDFRYKYKIFPKTTFATRFLGGFGIPHQKNSSLPFEYRFFLGGLNDMRGWQSNTLGPGTFKPDSLSNLITPGGNALLYTGAELRQKLNTLFELTLFYDIGNVWFTNQDPNFNDRRGRIFVPGVDAGIGIRMDFDFFIVRLDLAQQLYAPDIQKWIVYKWDDIGGSRFQYNFGIGYPF